MAKSVVQKIVNQAKVQEVRGMSDPIKIWDEYRDQALVWRALMLLQVPITVLALLFGILVWQGRETNITVPRNPAPGLYHPAEIPDRIFEEEASNFVNLIASYTPITARRQFEFAKVRLMEPLLTKFDEMMIQQELKAIETTSRSQLFFIDPTKTEVTRNGDIVEVKLVGDRMKMISTRPVPTVVSRYQVVMRTIPRNDLNPYGIIITDVFFEDVKDE